MAVKIKSEKLDQETLDMIDKALTLYNLLQLTRVLAGEFIFVLQ